MFPNKLATDVNTASINLSLQHESKNLTVNIKINIIQQSYLHYVMPRGDICCLAEFWTIGAGS